MELPNNTRVAGCFVLLCAVFVFHSFFVFVGRRIWHVLDVCECSERSIYLFAFGCRSQQTRQPSQSPDNIFNFQYSRRNFMARYWLRRWVRQGNFLPVSGGSNWGFRHLFRWGFIYVLHLDDIINQNDISLAVFGAYCVPRKLIMI